MHALSDKSALAHAAVLFLLFKWIVSPNWSWMQLFRRLIPHLISDSTAFQLWNNYTEIFLNHPVSLCACRIFLLFSTCWPWISSYNITYASFQWSVSQQNLLIDSMEIIFEWNCFLRLIFAVATVAMAGLIPSSCYCVRTASAAVLLCGLLLVFAINSTFCLLGMHPSVWASTQFPHHMLLLPLIQREIGLSN